MQKKHDEQIKELFNFLDKNQTTKKPYQNTPQPSGVTPQNTPLSGPFCSKLTQSEEEVLHLLVDEVLTPAQISLRRQTSISNTYKILNSLRKKGAYTTGQKKVEFSPGTIQPKTGIRLHAEQWLIKVLWAPPSFKAQNGQKFELNGNEVRIHSESIEVYSSHSFFGADTWAATAKSVDYWNKFFARVEHELNIIILKHRATNITRVKAEYAHIRNGLAIKAEEEKQRISIRAREDGKIWFAIDNSFDLHEAETKHPATAHRDMRDIVEPFFNDLRDRQHLPLSQVSQALVDIATFEQNIQKRANMVEKELSGRLHGIEAATMGLIKMMQGLGDGLKFIAEAESSISQSAKEQLSLLEIQTRSTAALAENIKSHIPAWMSNQRVERQLKRLNSLLSQKRLRDWF